MANNWLPSERKWINGVTEKLLDGEVILVRSPPRWGITSLCNEITKLLEETAVPVYGKDFSEERQGALREELRKSVFDTTKKEGCSQVIFDDYGHALKRSQGSHLHSMLYGLLIDAPIARDVGCLLVAGCTDNLELNFRGSPVLSRAINQALPVVSVDDAEFLNMSKDELRSLAGSSTWLARKLIGADFHFGKLNAVEHLNNDRRDIIRSLTPHATEAFLGHRTVAECDPISVEILRTLGTIGPDQKFSPSRFVAESRIPESLQEMNPGWPPTQEESLEQFLRLWNGYDDALWVDRYLLQNISELSTFLKSARMQTAAKLQILVGPPSDSPVVPSQIQNLLSGIDRVEIRSMKLTDRTKLHDRQLVFPHRNIGYTLPTGGVILAAHTPGSAVSAKMPGLAIDYSEIWARSSPVWH